MEVTNSFGRVILEKLIVVHLVKKIVVVMEIEVHYRLHTITLLLQFLSQINQIHLLPP
jgi:hypothetical protein